MRRIGIDVGGTNTDAVLIEDGKVADAVKAPTSEDVTTGILDSLKSLAATGVLKDSDGKLKRIDGVMIGTTHFINAVVQRRHLTKVAALRLGMPSKGRAVEGADADLIIVDARGECQTVVVGGSLRIHAGELLEVRGGTILCSGAGLAAAQAARLGHLTASV